MTGSTFSSVSVHGSVANLAHDLQNLSLARYDSLSSLCRFSRLVACTCYLFNTSSMQPTSQLTSEEFFRRAERAV